MRRLSLDLEEIAIAMEDHSGYQQYFFDTETGRLIAIPPELTELETCDEDEVEELVAGLPEWEQELVPEVLDVYSGDMRYVVVPTLPSYEGYDEMVEFAETVQDDRLRELLFVALDGRGAFGRFKRVLGGYPEERERWYARKDERMKERVREWLREYGIEAVDRPPTAP